MKTFLKKLIPWIGLILATQSLVLWVYGLECIVTHYPNRGIGMLIAIGIGLALSIIWVVVEMIIQAKKAKREKRNNNAIKTYDKLYMETEIQYSYNSLLYDKTVCNKSKQWLAFNCDAIIRACKSYFDSFGPNPTIKSIYEGTQEILKELDIK
jgi:hypothetical protein